jgi:heme exporter protein B
VNGTFFAAMSIRTRNRELMLPLLLLPVSIPAVVSMVSATTVVLTGEGSPWMYIKILAVFCVVYTTTCLLLFETVLNAE